MTVPQIIPDTGGTWVLVERDSTACRIPGSLISSRQAVALFAAAFGIGAVIAYAGGGGRD
jgi:hypothetical protein